MWFSLCPSPLANHASPNSVIYAGRVFRHDLCCAGDTSKSLFTGGITAAGDNDTIEISLNVIIYFLTYSLRWFRLLPWRWRGRVAELNCGDYVPVCRSGRRNPGVGVHSSVSLPPRGAVVSGPRYACRCFKCKISLSCKLGKFHPTPPSPGI
jgi:hypothetical protein